ncbi:MAG: hypothetical protein QXX94_06065 [Candidatus Bathyarchaeia archaeon]
MREAKKSCERKLKFAKKYLVCRRALSPVIAAIILASVLGIIVFVASNLANSVVDAQVEEAQFEQAKYVVLSLDKLIKRIMYEPESSGYIKTSFWKVTPYFEREVGNLTVEAPDLEITIPINVIKIKGGPRVGVPAEQNLLGDESLIITGLTKPLGNIKVFQENGAWILLDYARIRCILTGRNVAYYNGTGYEPYNTVEIILIKIEFKDFRAGEQVSFIAKNAGIISIQRNIDGGNFTITVTRTDLNRTESISLADLGGDPDCKTLLNVAIITIEVSILEGV